MTVAGEGGEERAPGRRPRRQKIAVTIAQEIVAEIARRRYPPGTKLAPEREMLAHYQVGRGTLRESLRFLEMNGVLTVKPGPGGGPVVAEPDAHDLASTLGLFLELKGTSFGAVLELRELLEPAIAGLAASNSSKETAAAIAETVDRMRANIDDAEVFREANEAFHDLVAAGSGNPILALLLSSLDHITDGTRIGISFPLERRRAVLSAHQRICDAVAAGDAVAATEQMRKHVRQFRKYTEEHYPTATEMPLRWSDVAP